MDRYPVATTALAFVAGFVDTVGFVGLFGLLTAHVTGNLVLLGAEVVLPGHGALIKLCAFPAFISGIALARMLVLSRSKRGRAAAGALLLLQVTFLGASLLVWKIGSPFASGNAPLAIVTGMLAAAAMGVQNAGGRLAWRGLSPTTVMTGNVTQLVIDLIDRMRGAGDAELTQRMRRLFLPVVGFGVGASAGGFAALHALLAALLLPLVILAVLASTKALEAEAEMAVTPDGPGGRARPLPDRESSARSAPR